jgi:hypothetical protein
MMRFLRRAALLIALIGATQAHAGRPCEARALTTRAAEQGLTLAEHTVERLNATSAKVVLIARVGQDLREYGLRYSHLGLAYRDGPSWRVVHKLNQCGSDRAALYRQGMGDFFLDAPFDYEAGIVVLSPQAQERLWPVLHQTAPLKRLHTRAYNMLAYPWSQRYQQSNQWALETLAMAMSPEVDSRAKAQDWLRLQGYEPTEIHLSPWTRLGARLTAANISFDDHPLNLRMAGQIRTVTVDSVFAWLLRTELGQRPLIVR